MYAIGRFQQHSGAVITAAILLISLGCGVFGTPVPTIDWSTPTPFGTPADPTTTTTPSQSGETATLPAASPTTAAAATATGTAPSPPATSQPTWTAPAPTQPPASPTDSPAPTSTAGPQATRIRFEGGATQDEIEGRLPAGGSQLFVLSIQSGQFVDIVATPDGILQDLEFSLTGADGTVIKPLGDADLRAVVPSTQDYYLELVSDDGAVAYTLSILIPVRVAFASGATSATVEGTLAANQTRHYVLRAQGGQTMQATTETTSGEVRLIVWGANGLVLQSGMVSSPIFTGLLLTTQDYIIAVQAGPGGPATYTMVVTIPPP